jgi:hypothetical protein
MCISMANKNKSQGVNDSIVVQVATPKIWILDPRYFLLVLFNILSSLINPWTHGGFELKGKACEQWHHWILEFQVPTMSSNSCKKSWYLGSLFMNFHPPNSNNTNLQLYITKFLIPKSNISSVGECYNH